MIKLVVMDVDGTMTDGNIYIGSNGFEVKAFNIKDGMGIVESQKKGIIFAVITGRNSDIVEKRCNELHIEYVFQGVESKLDVLCKLINDLRFSKDEVVYIGDDLNDLDCMNLCGFSCCPSDAAEVVKRKCNYISSFPGGRGAIRDILNFLFKI